MTQEQKAKAYDEAIERAKDMLSYKEVRREDMEYLFPELKESEDERIRKEILEYFQQFENEELRGVNISDWISWLEKQGEQKPAWSEEDEKYTQGLIRGLKANRDIFKFTIFISDSDSLNITSTIDWLESLKNRVQPQEKQEWSEEDKKHYQGCLNLMRLSLDTKPYPYYNDYLWLKSIRPQNRWKPSEEQMEALANALSLAKNCGVESAFDLRTLYEQLNKLK